MISNKSGFKDFSDYAQLRHDTEVLATLDKSREGKHFISESIIILWIKPILRVRLVINYFYRTSRIFMQSNEVQSLWNEIGKTPPIDQSLLKQPQEEM